MRHMHPKKNTDALRKEVATVVRNARARLAFTQKKMAALLGVSQPNISRYESGEAEPPSTVLMHCLHICGVASDLSASLAVDDRGWAEVLAALGHLETAIHSAAHARS